MKVLELARRMLELGEIEKAQDTYIIVANSEEATPEIQYEAAYFILQSGGDYKIAYTIFVNLFNQGHFQSEIFDILVASFYAPNVDKIKKLYHKNITRLSQYPYIFTKEFPYFDDLKIKFFPYDDDGFIPFFVEKGKFGEYINFSEDKEKYFFSDLSQPLKYQNIYSQFDLEYLYDNVRKSEWVAYDNHVYLHYTDKEEFAAYLQVLDFGGLIYDEKFVFLFDKEDKMYPLDFKKEYNIDYSTMTVKPLNVTEIKKLIWHAQSNAHTGVDFFNEIFDSHPNIMYLYTYIFDKIMELVKDTKTSLQKYFPNGKLTKLGVLNTFEAEGIDFPAFERALLYKEITEENVFIALYIGFYAYSGGQPNQRIVPALFFHPHYHSLNPTLTKNADGTISSNIEEIDMMEKLKHLRQFKYVRTFATFRRFTTRTAATYKFAYNHALENIIEKENETKLRNNLLSGNLHSIVNKFIYINKNNFLLKHSRAVRFEDGKLNPEATFTSLCEFLDLPYTNTMTYCSRRGELDPESLEGNVTGFNPEAIHRTYDQYINNSERILIEYMLKDDMEYLGYEPQYWDKNPQPIGQILSYSQEEFLINKYQQEVCEKYVNSNKRFDHLNQEDKALATDKIYTELLENNRKQLASAVIMLWDKPVLVSPKGEQLSLIKLIKPKEELLITEVYK